MEEDDDDLYGENGTTQSNEPVQDTPIQDAPSGEEEESDEGEDMEEDSDSDIDIITERPAGEEAPVIANTGDSINRTEGGRVSAAIPIVAPSQQNNVTAATKGVTDQTAQLTLESGLGFPGVHSSTVDVNGNPVYTPAGKPIMDIEVDVDLIEHSKPWRRPGADQSDYFNYGFDEFTWSTYCLRQKTVADAIVEQKADNSQFEMMFGGGGGMMPGMAAPPNPMVNPMANPMAAMGGMPGMGGNEQEFQAAMMEAMRQQGVSDPSKVDFNAFMAQLQGGGMMGQPEASAGPNGGQQNYGQGNWQQGGGGNFQQGGRGGYGRGKRGQRY